MMNPMQLVQMMRNPQQFVQQMTNNSQFMQNPMARNALQMYQNGDTKGMEQMARNMCRERGINPEDLIRQFNQMGIR